MSHDSNNDALKRIINRVMDRQKPLPILTTINVCGVDVDMTHEMHTKLQEFYKANNLPIEKLGAIGGEYTLCITPTSLGSVYVIQHSNGAELDLTPFETW